MITPTMTVSCGALLLVAGVLELWRTGKGDRNFLWASRMVALGFFILGSRYLYLALTDDLLRLHFVGTASIAVIATGRAFACIHAIRMKL